MCGPHLGPTAPIKLGAIFPCQTNAYRKHLPSNATPPHPHSRRLLTGRERLHHCRPRAQANVRVHYMRYRERRGGLHPMLLTGGKLVGSLCANTPQLTDWRQADPLYSGIRRCGRSNRVAAAAGRKLNTGGRLRDGVGTACICDRFVISGRCSVQTQLISIGNRLGPHRRFRAADHSIQFFNWFTCRQMPADGEDRTPHAARRHITY